MFRVIVFARLERTMGLVAVIALAGCSGATTVSTASPAQTHCPRDTVVWLNERSGIFHFAGGRWYGRTDDGGYICERDAVSDGDRASRNGQ